jgi:hypothetical protein
LNERDSFVIARVICSRLLDFAARSQATNEEKINDEYNGVDDADSSGGANKIHASGVWWPVVSLLRVTPIFKDGHGTGNEENSADEIQNCGQSPWNARKIFVSVN